jgi:repressor LexA
VATLTKKQLAILKFIREYWVEHEVAPTLAEIAEHFSVTKITIFEHISALERKQVIRRTKHMARSIEIIDPEFAPRNAHSYPLTGYVAAGAAVEAPPSASNVDVVELVRPSANVDTYCLRVRGDSMADAFVSDGDYILCERRIDATDGDLVVAETSSGVTLKRFFNDGDGQIRLEPANRGHATITATAVKVIGVVVGLVRSYRK